MKVNIKNVQTGFSKEVVLPIMEYDLLDITSDVLGRDEEGRVLEGQEYVCVDENGKNIENIFDYNNDLLERS